MAVPSSSGARGTPQRASAFRDGGTFRRAVDLPNPPSVSIHSPVPSSGELFRLLSYCRVVGSLGSASFRGWAAGSRLRSLLPSLEWGQPGDIAYTLRSPRDLQLHPDGLSLPDFPRSTPKITKPSMLSSESASRDLAQDEEHPLCVALCAKRRDRQKDGLPFLLHWGLGWADPKQP